MEKPSEGLDRRLYASSGGSPDTMPQESKPEPTGDRSAEGRSMMSKRPEVPLKTRWLLYAGAWAAAFLGCTIIPALLEGTIPDRDAILLWVAFSWLFPSGLAACFDLPSPLERIGLIAVFWLAYFVHGVLTLRSRTRVRFYILMFILATILSFNVLGCHRITSR
jgi:hypothetical protein